MIQRYLAALLCLSLAACDAPSAPQSQSQRLAGTPYPTDVGIIYVDVPPNYVAVSTAAPKLFERFQRQLPKLRLVEAFITREDLARSGVPDELMNGQVVQIQLFPQDSPPVSPEIWEELKSRLPGMLSGGFGRAHVAAGERKALQISKTNPDLPQVSNIATGEIVVYQTDRDSVRWATVGDLQLQNGVKAQLVLVSAARRVGNKLFLMQSVVRKQDDATVPKAIGAFNGWVEHVNAVPNRAP